MEGYTTILHSHFLLTKEIQVHEQRLIHLLYLAITYKWQAVLAYHGTVLLEVERRHAAWSALFHHLDARMLQGHFEEVRINCFCTSLLHTHHVIHRACAWRKTYFRN